MSASVAASLALLSVVVGVLVVALAAHRLRQRAKARQSWARAQLPACVIDDPVAMTWAPRRESCDRRTTIPLFSGSVGLAMRPATIAASRVQARASRRPRVYFG